jgi:6-phosphogluconolactonase
MVSGGSSPKQLFSALQNADLDWGKITVSLVDERWVEPGAEGSNESFIKDSFLQGRASAAKFISLKSGARSALAGLPDIEARFSDVPAPFDICVMGMGLDSHTASWFPGARGRAAAMAAETKARFAAVDAAGCGGAGHFPERITLTLSAVMDSRQIILFIPGAAKAAVFENAQRGTPEMTPVGALKSAGQRLTVYTQRGEGGI